MRILQISSQLPKQNEGLFVKNCFIRIIWLKTETNMNDLRINFRLRSCCGTLKSFCAWYSFIKVKNLLRIFPDVKFDELRITLRLALKTNYTCNKKARYGRMRQCSYCFLLSFDRRMQVYNAHVF